MSACKGIEVEVFPTLGGMVILPLKQYEEMKMVQANLLESLADERKQKEQVVANAQAYVKESFEKIVRLAGDIMTKKTDGDVEEYSDYVVGKATEIYNKALSCLANEPDEEVKP